MNPLLDIGGAGLNTTYLVNAFRLVLEWIKFIVLNDSVRIIVVFIVMFATVSRLLRIPIKKSPFAEAAPMLANSLSFLMMIALFYKTRGFLDKFSMFILIAAPIIFVLSFLIGGKSSRQKAQKTNKKAQNLANREVRADNRESSTTRDISQNTQEIDENSLAPELRELRNGS